MPIGTSNGDFYANSFDYTVDSFKEFSKLPQTRIDEGFSAIAEGINSGTVDTQGGNTLPEHARPTEGQLQHIDAADMALKMTPQERNLYERHLTNLKGEGGVDNPDGSRSTLFATTVGVDDKHYRIPTVYDGKILSAKDAIGRAQQEGFDKFPSYNSPEEAQARYDAMHHFMERDTTDFLKTRGKSSSTIPLQATEKPAGEFKSSQATPARVTMSDEQSDPVLAGQQYAMADDDIRKGKIIRPDFGAPGASNKAGGSVAPKAANDNTAPKTYDSDVHQRMIRSGVNSAEVSKIPPDQIKYMESLVKQKVDKKLGEGTYDRVSSNLKTKEDLQNQLNNFRTESDKIINKLKADFPDPPPLPPPASASTTEKAMWYGLSSAIIGASAGAGHMMYKGMLEKDYPMTEEGWKKFKEDFMK